jgi:hypothetical protein
LAAEYSRWVVDLESNQPTIFPASRTISDRMYVLGTYQVTNWFYPGAYYSAYFPMGLDKRDGPSHKQHDVALTLRFDLNDYWIVKLEGHYMHGTAILNSAQNGGAPLDSLENDWVLLLAKTTLHF